MRSQKRIRSEILKTEQKLKRLKEELSESFRREACEEVSTWRPDLKLMLGPPPTPVRRNP